MKKLIETKVVLRDLLDSLNEVELQPTSMGVQDLIRSIDESEAHLDSLAEKKNAFTVAPVTSYGRKEFRPVSKTALQFAELLEQNNFNAKDLARIKAMGIEIEIDMQAAVNDSIKELTEQMHNLFGLAPKDGGK